MSPITTRLIHTLSVAIITVLMMAPQQSSAQIFDKLKKKAQQVLEKKNKKTDSTSTENASSSSSPDSQDSGNDQVEKASPNGVVTIIFDGKSYTQDSTFGHILQAPDKVWALILYTKLGPNPNNLTSVQILMNNPEPYKTGVHYSLKKSADPTQIDNTRARVGTFEKNRTAVNGFPEIMFSSDDGSFTITYLQIIGETAIISGDFTFNGRHFENQGRGPAKPYSIKGTFQGVTMLYKPYKEPQ